MASLEACAASFIAMADTGGHGVDEYLENNFQYPEGVMTAALALSIQTGGIDTKENKVDRSKATMPAAVFALGEEACSILRQHLMLSWIHAELLLKLAWYAAELEESHLRCRWGEGCYDGSDSIQSSKAKRWENMSVAKLDLVELKNIGGLDPILSPSFVARCERFTNLLHRAVSIGGLDLSSRLEVALTCSELCLLGVKPTQWAQTSSPGSKWNETAYKRLIFPRKAAYFCTIAAEAAVQSKVGTAYSTTGLWLAASYLYSTEGNNFDCKSQYAWASLRVTMLHMLSQQSDCALVESGKKKNIFCLY